MSFDKQAAIDMENQLPDDLGELHMNHYQEIIAASDFPDPAHTGPVSLEADGRYPLWYYALGLVGESGEAADKIKKIYRNEAGVLTSENTLALAYELGDALWYLTRIAAKVNLTLGQVAGLNVLKLSDRAKRDVLRSSGDAR